MNVTIFGKIRMQIFLESHGVEVWNFVEEGSIIPTTIVDTVKQPSLNMHGMRMIKWKFNMTKGKKYYSINHRNEWIL